MTKKIKILFLAASPLDSGRLQLDKELREIEKRIQMGTERDWVELISEWAVTPDDLQQALLKHKPHIVHFSGHGSKTQGIVLEDQFGNSQMMSKSALIEVFKILKDDIHVIVLNACYSGRQAEELSEVTDYTVVVPTSISDNAAIPFVASFYQGLTYGRLVKEAFDLAKNLLRTKGVAKTKLPDLLVRKGAVREGINQPASLDTPPPSPTSTPIGNVGLGIRNAFARPFRKAGKGPKANPAGKAGKELLEFAGTIKAEDAKATSQAIEVSSKIVDVHDTETSLSELVSLALKGNDVIIAENEKPLVRLIPISESKQLRTPGLNRGEIWTSEDFDEPLTDSFWTGTV